MARGFDIKIEGLDKLTKKIQQLPATMRKNIGAEIGFAAHEMADLAKVDAPADQGTLRQEITFKKINELNYEYISQAGHSGFVEFGTRTKVQIPSGLQEYADVIIKSASSSLSAKEAIFAWCKRKGIDEKAWYAIYLSVMRVGINPHPFFFKQVDRVKPSLIANIKKVVDNP